MKYGHKRKSDVWPRFSCLISAFLPGISGASPQIAADDGFWKQNALLADFSTRSPEVG
jgi:hypothetical protein